MCQFDFYFNYVTGFVLRYLVLHINAGASA